MKILCAQTNRNRLCDGCGDTASDNRCKTCYDESRGIPDPVEASQQQFLESLGPLVAPIEIEDDLPDVYSGDAGLAKMKEKLCGTVITRCTYCDTEPNCKCVPLPYIEPLYSKELPTKSGVYSVRYKIISDIYKTMEVTVERLNDISFIVKAPGLQMPLDVFCKSAWNVEWLFIRDLETQEID